MPAESQRLLEFSFHRGERASHAIELYIGSPA
jgi:hypothetical protein